MTKVTRSIQIGNWHTSLQPIMLETCAGTLGKWQSRPVQTKTSAKTTMMTVHVNNFGLNLKKVQCRAEFLPGLRFCDNLNVGLPTSASVSKEIYARALHTSVIRSSGLFWERDLLPPRRHRLRSPVIDRYWENHALNGLV